MKFFGLHKNILRKKISTRWWWGLLKNSLLVLLLLVLPYASSFAQDEIKPPIFDFVSINPANGEVTIQWQPSPTLTVVGYVIQEEVLTGQSFPISTINITQPPYSYKFFYPKVLNEPVKFNIVAIDGNGKESIRTTPSHVTVFAKLSYDSCNTSIHISWSRYVGWSDKLAKYSVFNAQTYQIVGEVDTAVHELVVPNVQENREYCYYVSATKKDGQSSLSNQVCITTNEPLPPTYISGDFTRFNDANQVELHFSIDPATVNDAYRLYRSTSTVNYSLVGEEVNKEANGTLSYTDVLPSRSVYNYKLVYVNQCAKEGVESIPINNILLNAKNSGMTNHLSWNRFSSWVNGTGSTEIYRNNELLISLSASASEFDDVIGTQTQLSGEVCYQIKAVSNTDPYSKVNVSESNTFCVNMLGDIFVPNAFTPNGDTKNDVFLPSFSIIPINYTMIIYNRYGFKIFETSDYSQGWDGRLSDGSKALESAYIYYIKIDNGAGKVLEKRGNFTVIYP